MSTGEGIFLAGVAIAFALLMWNPATRRIVGKSLKWIIGVAIVVGLGNWAYVSYENYSSRKGVAPPSAPTSDPQLAGVKLGESRNDVIYKKGMPKKSVDDDDEYENAMIYYEDKRVLAVYYECGSDSWTKLNGVACGDSATSVMEKFKGKIKEFCLADTPTNRIFMVAEFNSVYILQKEAVMALGVKSGTGKKWVACNTER